MNINEILGTLTTLLFAIPVLLILFLRLYVNKSLLMLAVYCTFTALYNAMNSGLLSADQQFFNKWAVFTNYTDAPLMLGLLILYCHTKFKRNLILLIGALILMYEIVVAFRFGLAPVSSLYISGVGLVLIFALGVYFFITQLKHTVRFGKGLGRTFIAAAIFFGYGLYVIVYLLYFIYNYPDVSDVFQLYYASSMIFCVLASAGVLQLYRRHRMLQQVLVVRRELQQFFRH